MKFKKINIENFRNFKKVDIDLCNRNILIGENNTGKTNLMDAIRFVIDRNLRKKNFSEEDFKDISKKIEILITLSIVDDGENNVDNEKIRARLKGALRSNKSDVYLKLEAEYDMNSCEGIIDLYWGTELEDLKKIDSKNDFFEIDKLFNVVYIGADSNLNNDFKNNLKNILQINLSEINSNIDDINENLNALNEAIEKLPSVNIFIEDLEKEFRVLNGESRNNYGLRVLSERSFDELYNYINIGYSDSEGTLKSDTGAGDKQILNYILYKFVADNEKQEKINIFMLEALENNMYRDLQESISKLIFSKNEMDYLFLTTYSPYMLTYMDESRIVKINKMIRSYYYSKEIAGIDKNINEAIFYNKVRLFKDSMSYIESKKDNKIYSMLLEESEEEKKYKDVFKKLGVNYEN